METLWLQPTYYSDFHCIGAACEDTCCSGWGISVDRETFERYQQFTHPALGPKLTQLVTIQSPGQINDYARLAMQGDGCSLIRDGLCSVQADLGEEYLSRTCATYPRIVNAADGIWERSLDLSCPEAARVALLNPEPDDLQSVSGNGLMEERLLQIARDRRGAQGQLNLTQYARPVRECVLQVFQNRRFKVEKRLLLVGFLCEKLHALTESGQQQQIPEALELFRLAMDAQLFDQHLNQLKANAASQLAVVLELVVARMKADYTAPRFRDVYGDFTVGLGMQGDSTIPELAIRYGEAHDRYFAPFVEEHEYIFEHYLVAYAYRTLFPFRHSIADEYLLLSSCFGLTRALAIGLAGKDQMLFGEGHLVKAIQTCSRALEHCASFPDEMLSILAGKGVKGVAGAALLTQNFG